MSDKAGKVVFDGPIDTDEQRRNIPKQILEKVEQLEKGATLSWDLSPNTRRYTFQDGAHTLTVFCWDERRYLIAHDRSGKAIFAGAIGTPELRKNVPQEIIQKLKELESLIERDPLPW